MTADPVIRFKDVSKVFQRPDGRGDFVAVDKLSFEIAKGEIVAIERGVKDAHGQLETRDASQVLRQLTSEWHAAVRDRHQVQAVLALVALQNLVGDPDQGAPNRRVVQHHTLFAGAKAIARLSRRSGAGRVRGRVGVRHRDTFVRLAGRT
jgi:hypothetical protein